VLWINPAEDWKPTIQRLKAPGANNTDSAHANNLVQRNKMKAIVATKFGGPEVLAYLDLDDPQPQPDQVLIRVHSTGVNFADVKARTNVHHIQRPLPFIPGLDTTGTIEAVGSEVKKLKVGQRVVAFPQGGSYCELALAHEMLTFAIPDAIDDDTAAAFPVVAGTSYAMLSLIARLQAGQGLLLHSAAGGVGTTALQIAKALGARPIITTVGSDAKKKLLEELGADAVVNYRSENYVEKALALTDGKGVGVILNPLGGELLERDLDCLASFGRLVCFGNASGAPASFLSNQLQGSCRSVLGFSFGTLRRTQPQEVFGIMQAVIALLAEGKFRMVMGKRFPLAEAAEAHRYLESRESTGKILLNV
jgi:NADPH2:quinone reductase